MDAVNRNDHGVPQYPRGHAGRLFVVLAAIDTLERPTATSISNLTGIAKSNIDRLAIIDLPSHFGVRILKDGPVYKILDWGIILKKEGVKKCLRVPLNGTNIEASSK